MNKKFIVSAIASVAFAFAFATGASAVYSADIYTMSSGYLMVGSGMGAKVSQMPNVMAAQKALNACTNSNLAVDGKFGPLTKGVFVAFQNSKNIKPDGIIGPVTANELAACSGGASTPSNGGSTGSLSGGAGDADVTKTTTDVEDTLKEGEEDVNVLGFEVSADGSDIKVTAVKVTFSNDGYASSSERLERYIDGASIMMDDEEVGSVDVEDFNRETDTPDTYSATISLDNAVVDEDDEVKFYVAVSAASSIDSDDVTNGDWKVVLDTVRFNDATGAILTASLPSSLDTTGENFTFDEAGADDDLSVKSSSKNPEDVTVKVDENADSDEILALAFKLDVDEDSSDITIFDLPIDITVGDFGSATDIDDIIDSLVVKVGGDEFDADVVGSGALGSDPDTVVYGLDLEDGDLVIDAGDTVEVEVWITFKEQDDNYALNTTVVASIDASDIEAEGEDDDIAGASISSDRTGGTLTLNTSVATVSNIDWDVPSTGSIIDFLFTVEAEDEDVDVEIADIIAVDSTAGTATVGTPTVTKISGDATGSVDDYVVSEGDTARFRVRYAITGANGTYANVTITSIVGQEVADNDQVSPTATRNVN